MILDADKPSLSEYPNWLNHQFGSQPLSVHRGLYEARVAQAARAIEESAFWTDLARELAEWGDAYLVEHKLPLLQGQPTVSRVLSKPWGSFLEKTYRRNVLHNEQWPGPPAKHGWCYPDNWFSQINDPVRTQFVVKYLDGVQYLVARMQEWSKSHGLGFRSDFEAKAEGYYAAHTYTTFRMELPKANLTPATTEVSLEIQITTQLKEVIRALTHVDYEKRRIDTSQSQGAWQWNYQSDEFLTNYLGHLMHYLVVLQQ